MPDLEKLRLPDSNPRDYQESRNPYSQALPSSDIVDLDVQSPHDFPLPPAKIVGNGKRSTTKPQNGIMGHRRSVSDFRQFWKVVKGIVR